MLVLQYITITQGLHVSIMKYLNLNHFLWSNYHKMQRSEKKIELWAITITAMIKKCLM